MFVFNFVSAHWMVFSIGYLTLFFWTAKRFAERIRVRQTDWYQTLYWIGFGEPKKRLLVGNERRFYPFRAPLMAMLLLLGYILAPLLAVLFFAMDRIERKEQREIQARAAELQKQKDERRKNIELENGKRRAMRQDWFSRNKPTLYFNTVNGVTAVLRPADLESAKRQTARDRINELWPHSVLKPHPQTIVFVTKTGSDLIGNYNRRMRDYKVAGWLADLQEICQASNCSLIREETIFVPWVNESILPFSEQAAVLMDCHSQGNAMCLIEKQAPPELHPLPLD